MGLEVSYGRWKIQHRPPCIPAPLWSQTLHAERCECGQSERTRFRQSWLFCYRLRVEWVTKLFAKRYSSLGFVNMQNVLQLSHKGNTIFYYIFKDVLCCLFFKIRMGRVFLKNV